MKLTNKRFLSVVIIICLVFQSILINTAAYAIDAKNYETSGNDSEIKSGMADDEVNSKINEHQSNVKNAQEQYNKETSQTKVDKALKEFDKSGNDNESTNSNSAKKAAAKGTLDKAKAQMNQLKNSDSSSTTIDSNNSVKGNNLKELTGSASARQKMLNSTGKGLISLGTTFANIGTALIVAGTALSAFPFTAAIGAMMKTVGKVLVNSGNAMKAIGNVLVSTAESAKGADKSFGQLVNEITDAAKEGWKQGSEEAAQAEQGAGVQGEDTASEQGLSITSNDDDDEGVVYDDLDQSGVEDF